jgi:hypothetical protein
MSAVLAAIVFSLAVLAQTPPPVQLPPRPVPPVPVTGAGQGQTRDQEQRLPVVGTGRLSGSVVSSETGQPLKNARVSLSGGPVGRSAATDAQGNFTFDKLPAGRYNLSASRQRYLSSSYGQKKPERSGTAIQLADAEQLKNLTIRLFPTAVITGTVFGDDGEPMMNARVTALRYSMRSGFKRLEQRGSAQTDDRGVYRLHGLTPGEYVISSVSNSNESMQLEMMVEMERLAMAGANVTSWNSQEGVMTLGNGARIEQPSPVTFAPTYYPGTTLPGGAQSVTVASGEERGAIDFALQKVQTATVSGTVVVASGALPSNINISVQPVDEAAMGSGFPSARVQPDGRFSLRAIPPGAYIITARAQTAVRVDMPMPAAAAGAAAEQARAAVAQTLQQVHTGRIAVSVDGQPINNLILTLDGGRSVSGRVTFSGGTPPDLTRGQVRASLRAIQTATGGQTQVPAPIVVGQDGSFKITGVVPGRYALSVSGAQGFSLKSAIVGGRDSQDFPFDVDDQDITGAAVTMAYQQARTELNGTLMDQTSKPAVDYTIVVFTSDQRFWTPQSRRIVTTRPGTDGKYTVAGLPPGDYQIAAVNDLEPGGQYDLELLKALLVASTRVTLTEGGKISQDLRINVQ